MFSDFRRIFLQDRFYPDVEYLTDKIAIRHYKNGFAKT